MIGPSVVFCKVQNGKNARIVISMLIYIYIYIYKIKNLKRK